MERRRKCIVYVTALAWLSFATLAYALDDKVFSGTACQPEIPTSDNSRLNYIGGHVQNNGGDGFLLVVVCPVVRDNITNTNGTNSASVRVQSNGSASVTCILTSYNQFGGFLQEHAASTTSNSPKNLALDVNASSSGGYYGLRCFLPPSTKLFSYRVSEF